MGDKGKRQRHVLSISISVAVGLAIGVFAVQGCGSQASKGKVGASCSSSSPCQSGLVCTAGTCQTPAGATDGGSPGTDGGTCGVAPVSDCGPCADGTVCGSGTSVCTKGQCTSGCYVNGAFYQAGAADPTADCQVCDPTQNLHGFSPKADGANCLSDGNACTKDACTSGNCTHTPVAQGTACGTSGQCDGSGHCSQGCTIGGTFYADGDPNPNNPCQACQVSQSTTAWSPRANGSTCPSDNDPCTKDACTGGSCTHTPVTGTGCGTGKICDASHTCSAGCYIGGTVYAAGAVNPTNKCQVCTPQTSTTAWSNAADGTNCDDGNLCNGVSTCKTGACTQTTPPVTCGAAPTCETGTGACVPTTGVCSYTPSAGGTSCGGGKICDGSGSCQSGCDISGTFYAGGAQNPANPCQVCQPSASTSGWTNDATGTKCGTGQVCSPTNTCQAGCYINNAYYARDAANPTNKCQLCLPSTSTTAWSNIKNGTNCDDGNLCNGVNTCQSGACTQTTPPVSCTNPPKCYASPGSCAAPTGACSYTPSPGGTSCGSGMVCDGTGSCKNGCFINGTYYPAGTTDPSLSCYECNPAQNTGNWVPKSVGSSCGTGKVCTTNQCIAGCYIGGTVYASGQLNPTNSCQACEPATSTTSWTDLTVNTACASDGNSCTNDVCDGSGTCTHYATTGASCGTGMVCNGSTCSSGCFIGGTYYAAGATNPNGNKCSACVPSASTTAWSNNAGYACSDGNNCTMNDACVNQTCVGTPYTCTPASTCQYSICNGDGTCSTGNLSAGSLCHNGCGTGYCSSTGSCTRCTSNGSQCCLGIPNLKGGTSYTCVATSSTTSCQ